MSTEEFDTFVEDLLGEKLPRPIIIVGASKIDDLLHDILAKFFIDPHDPKNDELLKGDNPLSTFSSRIKLVYRIGLIGISLYDTLEKVRKIRNLCAHRVEFDIKKSPVRDHYNDLKNHVTKRTSYNLTKTRYFNERFSNIEELQCMFVTVCVVLEAVKLATTKTFGTIETIKISNT